MFKNEAERESEQFKLEFKKGLYDEFDPYVKKVLSVLKKVFFNEDIRKYIITSKFVYPEYGDNIFAIWQIRSKSEKLYLIKDCLEVMLSFDEMNSDNCFGVYIKRKKRGNRAYSSRKYSGESVFAGDSFDKISKMLLKLTFNLYIEQGLFFI